jgi:hypothetical protein
MMDPVSWFLQTIDPVLIAPYRWFENPVIGWWIGTVILAIWCTALGELTTAVMFRVNRAKIGEVTREMTDRHFQSMNALSAGDKSAYKAINRLANEAYGKSLFLQIAMASASLWPAAFALAWLQSRFSSVSFPILATLPVTGKEVSYVFVFIPIYILVRIVFGKMKAISHRFIVRKVVSPKNLKPSG